MCWSVCIVTTVGTFGTAGVGAGPAVYLVSDNSGLYKAVDQLAEDVKDMRMELRCLSGANHVLKTRVGQ